MLVLKSCRSQRWELALRAVRDVTWTEHAKDLEQMDFCLVEIY